MTFGYVPPPFGPLWDYAVRLLDKAVTKGGNRWEDVSRQLRSGQAQLWLGMRGRVPVVAGVSRLDGATLEIWLAGGAVLSGFLPCLETVIEASKEAGATHATITGRKGWARVLGPYGWRQSGDNLVKEWS